jgi:hypothetical protein
MSEKPTKARLLVLTHIHNHETPNMGARVPDVWISEADRSAEDGQTTKGADGRRLTQDGAAALETMLWGI